MAVRMRATSPIPANVAHTGTMSLEEPSGASSRALKAIPCWRVPGGSITAHTPDWLSCSHRTACRASHWQKSPISYERGTRGSNHLGASWQPIPLLLRLSPARALVANMLTQETSMRKEASYGYKHLTHMHCYRRRRPFSVDNTSVA